MSLDQKNASHSKQPRIPNRVFQARRRERLKAEGYKPVTVFLAPDALDALEELKATGQYPCNITAISGALKNMISTEEKD